MMLTDSKNRAPQNHIFFKYKKEAEITNQIHRSSALFYFRVNEVVDTELHFLNYWGLKRSIENLKFSITCYDMAGQKLFVQKDLKIIRGANVFSLKQLLKDNFKNSYPKEGSFEFEILCDEHLFMSYPAAVVRYVGSDWHTLAHSTQRIYSETSGDSLDLISSEFLAEEGNQTIQSEEWFEPFFIIHNGPHDLVDEEMKIEIQSINQETEVFNLPTVSWLPRETKTFWLKDLCDYRSVTGGDIGTFSVKFKVAGVFPRIVAGLADTRNDSWSIDHTNFAAKSGPVLNDVFDVTSGSDDNLVFVMPNIVEDGWRAYADIYPTFPKGEFSVQLNDGRSEWIRELEKFDKQSMIRVDLKNEVSTSFSFQNIELKLPRRLHMGLHYQYRDGAPGFLIDGPLPHTASPISTRWCPIFADRNQSNYILISDRKLGSDSLKGLSATISFFNESDANPIVRNFEIKAGDTLTLEIEQEKELKNFIGVGMAWAYIKFSEPCHPVVHYVSRFEKSVAVCHAF